MPHHAAAANDPFRGAAAMDAPHLPTTRPRPVLLITFSGLDGAGKSTLIEWLRTTLESQDRRVAVFHMNDDVGVYAYARALRDRMWGPSPTANSAKAGMAAAASPAVPEQLRRPAAPGALVRRIRTAIIWNKALRRMIYAVDLVLFALYRLWVERIGGRVLIMDRYFYDTLVDVSDGQRWGWIRVLERLTPMPDVPIYLDITPEESFARKGEYSVEYLRRRRHAYRTVFPWIPAAVTIANDDILATKMVLTRAVQERLRA